MKNNFLSTTKTTNKGMLLKTILLTALMLNLLVAVACTGATKISDVMSNSSKYTGKTITIKGTVGGDSMAGGSGKRYLPAW
jgi:hypothetical protein